MKYAVVSCTNRQKPNSRIISDYYKLFLEKLGHQVSLIDLSNLPHDFTFSALYDNAQKNPEFNRFQLAFDEASKLVFVIPEYNGSFPGVFKAFIDGLEYPNSFRDKKAALVGHSAGNQGGALALSHATDILNYLGTHVLAFKVRLLNVEDHLGEGNLSKKYSGQLEMQAKMLSQF